MRIYNDFFARKLGIGDVHVYILASDTSAVASLSIDQAMDSSKMIAFLEQMVSKLHTAPGPPIVKPHPMSRPPADAPGSLVIHLVSRALEGGSWHEFPVENWIVLSGPEWGQLLPPANAGAKSSWDVPNAVAIKLAEWVYPQNEEKTTDNRSRVDIANFRLTMVTIQGNLARARIEGKIRLMHSFSPGGQSQDFANSELTGFMDFDVAERLIQRLRIVTTKAAYNTTPFATAMVSMSRETLEALNQ